MSTLQAGDAAPAFEGLDQDGQAQRLSDYAGQKLVLFFYPKDDTPGCTAEACNLRDHYEALRTAGYALLGVSPDAASKHQKFRSKYGLPFPLIADTERQILQAYGVWGPKTFMGRTADGVHRTTFVIDEKGHIARIIAKVNTKAHAEQILNG